VSSSFFLDYLLLSNYQIELLIQNGVLVVVVMLLLLLLAEDF
jgi:hypothetical protein